MPTIVIYPEEHLGPILSNVAAWGPCLLVPALIGLIALVGWLSNRFLAARAHAAEESDAPLQPGTAVVKGTVEHARSAPFAVRVEVEQLGIESTNQKGVVQHEWKEMDRRQQVHPFYVRDLRGQRIRVEPPNNVRFLDDLDEVTYAPHDVRVRRADLSPGEEVYVIGVLGTGPDPESQASYRSPGTGPVLRAPARGRMLIATRPPATRFRARAFVHGLWCVLFAIALCLLQGIVLFHTIRTFWGQSTTGIVTSMRTFTTKTSKGTIVHHWAVSAKVPGGRVFEEEVVKEDYDLVKKDSPIAVVHVPGRLGYEILGKRSTVHFLALAFPLVVCLGLFLGYYFHLQALRPWYDRRVNDVGGGPLPKKPVEPRPEPAIPL